jgi:intracellular multiplication protein IcmD
MKQLLVHLKNWVFTGRSCKVLAGLMMIVIGLLFGETSFASGGLESIAANVVSTFSGVAKLITAGSYVAGLGFGVGAIMKFKAHKDNPTQITIGAPIALLFVAAALIFLPSIFTATGKTLFGPSASIASVEGKTTFGGY